MRMGGEGLAMGGQGTRTEASPCGGTCCAVGPSSARGSLRALLRILFLMQIKFIGFQSRPQLCGNKASKILARQMCDVIIYVPFCSCIK